MKKRTISKLKSLFGSKKGKRQQEQQQSLKSSRSPSPDLNSPASTGSESFRPIQRTPPPTRVGPPPSPPVPTNPIVPVAPEPSGPLPLSPCPVCGRTFVPQSLAKHVKICEKMTVKKRKTFDSSRQRREGTDLEQYLPKNFGLPENSPFLEKSPPNTAKAAPKPKNHSVRSAIMKPAADLQKCPHCNRAFGLRAFERHVEWCADKAKILPAAPGQPPPHIADAKQRLNARTQYKAPPVRGRRSSQTREKSSNSRSASVESTRGISPPREYGDYRHTRTRASESTSSNDYHEENTAHVPVIRNSRVGQNNSSGDANVKARQARLARDLSSSRPIQESDPIDIQQTNTDLNIKKDDKKSKPKSRFNIKKREQLKKLEEIANKYNEKNQNVQKDKLKNRTKSLDKKDVKDPKSQIPIPRKTNLIKEKKGIESQVLVKTNNVNTIEAEEQPTSSSLSRQNDSSSNVKNKVRTKQKIKKDSTKKIEESTMSLDSLDNGPLNTNREKNSQSVGINTELLCPCIPCVIYDNSEYKPVNKKRNKSLPKNKIKLVKIDNSESPVELLYKNPKILSFCDVESDKTCNENIILSNENLSLINYNQANLIECKSFTDDSLTENNLEKEKACEDKNTTVFNIHYINYIEPNKNSSNDNIVNSLSNLSAENIETNCEHDLSAGSFEDSFDIKKDVSAEADTVLVSRHSSGDTYTKFTEDPADLEEFLSITDKMISDSNEKTQLEINNIEKSVQNIHTPRTDSIESMNGKLSENSTKDTNKSGPVFSDTLEELKSNLKDLLKEADHETDNLKIYNETKESEYKKNVCDMEHITVYGLKFYEQKQTVENNLVEERPSEFKLPSINKTNKFSQNDKDKNVHSNIYKANRNFRMLKHKKRTNSEYRTFIIKENQEDNCDESPPLKLPRIENKSSNNIVSDKIFPSSIKRSTSLLDSIQKKTGTKIDNSKGRHKTDQLEDDLMQSLKDFDKFYESERIENQSSNKEVVNNNKIVYNDKSKKEFRRKVDHKPNKHETNINGNYTPNGKSTNDSAYSRLVSLNRISPSKLSLCNAKEQNGVTSHEQIPVGSDSNSSHKDDVRSISSEEFLAMERSAELDGPIPRTETHKELETPAINDKRVSSRASSRHSPTWRQRHETLSSSGSETSLHRQRRDSIPAPRLSRFCHECGNKFPVETAKFCIECGVKRLVV
ncbi:J domain-containing protein DDB_G0295729 isoform X6 [Vanessa cardui]|uniref:J domain-containing protein DDB_G0295729 isoform X6 n=1 Tax=Vanessa cardui TaxID=171605 RepID=UPI001F138B75|nr:J domain-containing protein DDB_G0295729 isoform X6 [Vanessa cardui]